MSEFLLESTPEAIDDARRWVTAQLEQAGVGEYDRWAVELALTETLSNVIRHAYRGDSGREIRLGASFDGGRLELRVVHWGEPLDAAYERREPDDVGQGGYGLHLIGELMDDVVTAEAPGGATRITLVKSRWEGR